MHRRFRGAGVTVPCNLISESDSLGPGDSDPGSPSDDHHADDASHRDGQTVSDPDRQAGQHTLDSDASASHCLANLQPRGPEFAVTVMVAAAPGLGLAVNLKVDLKVRARQSQRPTHGRDSPESGFGPPGPAAAGSSVQLERT